MFSIFYVIMFIKYQMDSNIMDLFISVPFIKMEGIGNDYIYFDFTEYDFNINLLHQEFIKTVCDRRFGIGSDGLVILVKSNGAEFRMYMWNADGSSSDICGNALRSVSFYWYKKVHKKEFLVESGAGIHNVLILEDNNHRGKVKVSMGKPIFEKERIPYLGNDKVNSIYKFSDKSILPYEGYVVSMGNPHCVFFVDDPDSINLQEIGPKLEHHPLFPERANIEFVSIRNDGTIYQRTWERGSGETLACGSGACVVHVVSVLINHLNKKNLISLKGGSLEIEWDDVIWMSGDVSMVFSGYLNKEYFKSLFNWNL